MAAQLADMERVQAPVAAVDSRHVEEALGRVTQLHEHLDQADYGLLRLCTTS